MRKIKGEGKITEASLLQLDFHRGYLLTSLNKRNGTKWANQGSQVGYLAGIKQREWSQVLKFIIQEE